MRNIPWNACCRDFEPDGALRDVYVRDTTIEHWRTVYDMLRAAFRLEYSVDGISNPAPVLVDEVFAARDKSHTMLRFRVGDIAIGCHFFTVDQIEFDVDPREIVSQASLNELLGFLVRLGKTVGQTVIIARENDEQHPFISYESKSGEFKYHQYVG